MALTRMSSLERWIECPGFAAVDTKEDKKSPNAQLAAAYGKCLHSVKEGLEWVEPDVSHLSTDDPPFDAQAEFRSTFEEDKKHFTWLRDRYAGWEHEVHVAYRLKDRKPFRFTSDAEKQGTCSMAGHESSITGCTDGVRFDRTIQRIHVNDLKTSEHPVALDDPQLLGYALWATSWAMRELNFDPELLSIALSVLHWPRKGEYRQEYLETENRPAIWYSRDVGLDELVTFRRTLTASLEPALRGHLEPGAHCVYCPGALSCKAHHPGFTLIGKRPE